MELDGSMSSSNMEQVDRTVMRLVRAILAVVIGLSVAMLPAAGFAAPVINSAAQGPSEAEPAKMTTSSEMPAAMHDCCPDKTEGQPCDPSNDHCPMAFCAAQPVSIASAAVFQLDFPIPVANLLPIPVDQVVSLHSGSPPFRPPRV
jgi:hypothetical protein